MLCAGAPDPPSRPTIQQPQIGDRHVTMQWQPGSENYSPIRNFTIQYQRGEREWTTVPDYVDNEMLDYTVTGCVPTPAAAVATVTPKLTRLVVPVQCSFCRNSADYCAVRMTD